eukprot:1144812-Pelagomonas_calceolata.AAC.8
MTEDPPFDIKDCRISSSNESLHPLRERRHIGREFPLPKAWGVPSTVLQPELSWPDRAKFHDTLERLAKLFIQVVSGIISLLDGALDRAVQAGMALSCPSPMFRT